jgi:hypothetical protein
MTLPKNTAEIDGLEVRTQQLSVMRALPLWVRVSNILAPAFDCLDRLDSKTLEVLKEKYDKDELTQSDVINLLPVLGPFLKTLEADAVTRLARELFTATQILKTGPDGKKRKIELQGTDSKIVDAFGTSLLTMIKALWFVGRVNFRSFSSAGETDESPPADEAST